MSGNVVEDLADVLDVETAIDVLTDHNDGSKTASTHATQAVEREFAIRRSLAHLDVKYTLDFLKQTL